MLFVPWSGTRLAWLGSYNSANLVTNGNSSIKFCFSFPSLAFLLFVPTRQVSSEPRVYGSVTGHLQHE